MITKMIEAMIAPMNCCKGSLYRKKPMAKSNFTLAFRTLNPEDKPMRRVVAVALTAVLITGNFTTFAKAAAPKAGATCSKVNQSQASKGMKFTCVKSGKKLVWKKSSVIPIVRGVDFSKTYSTDNGYFAPFASACDFDLNIPAHLKDVQDYFYLNNRCAGQLQLGKYTLGSKRPTTTFDAASKFSNFEPCKLTTPQNLRSNLGYVAADPYRRQIDNLRRHPSPNTVIQFLPIYSSDTALPTGKPADDYKVFLDFFRNWIEYSSDFGSNVKVQIPTSYLKMSSPLGEYQLQHPVNWDTPSHVRFNRDLVTAVDPLIDFTGVNLAIVVPPPGTEAKIFAQAAIGSLSTNEGTVGNVMTEYAAFATNPKGSPYSGLGHPFWWVHEIMHAGVGFDDHYGDGKKDVNTEYGMGHLTLMTPFGGDLTTWEKLRLGFVRESQVQCKSDSTSSTHWIAPSTVKTTESKAVVIPISPTKVVVVESLRQGGLFYKHPVQSQGVIAYEIDLTKSEHGYGMKLSLPIGRTVERSELFMASAPLKQGESTLNNGYKITVVESGTFGDVIKVEKQ